MDQVGTTVAIQSVQIKTVVLRRESQSVFTVDVLDSYNLGYRIFADIQNEST